MRNNLITRAIIVGATGLALTVSATACGDSGSTSKDSIVKAMKKDSDLKSYSDGKLNCLAGVFKKYVKDSEIKKAVSGDDSTSDVTKVLKNKGDSAKFEKEATACVK